MWHKRNRQHPRPPTIRFSYRPARRLNRVARRTTPTRTPTLTPVLAEMIGAPTNLRDGPGLDFNIVAELDPGTRLPVLGRWLGFDWLQVRWDEAPDGPWHGCMSRLVLIIGDITIVPAVEPPSLPTIEPTQAALQATATVLMQTPGAAQTATIGGDCAVRRRIHCHTGRATRGWWHVLPTFTPPEPYQQLQSLPTQTPTQARVVVFPRQWSSSPRRDSGC